jgi:hypothetical protein
MAVAVAPRVAPGVLDGLILAATTVVTAGGPLSPDLDQQAWWRMADRVLPDEALGHGGPMRHRGITHWWGLPAALAYALSASPAHSWAWWAAAGVALGWASHLLGDFVVGAKSRHRDAGIPLAPWWWHVGLGAPCGGVVEQAAGVALPAVAVWQAAVVAGVLS